MSYLNRRITKALGTDELNLKVLSLDMLMTAFAAKNDMITQDQTITMKVPGLAKHYANLLAQGKFVAFQGDLDWKPYYVVARGNDLVAIYQPFGSWFDIYAAKATSDHVLHEVGITTPTFTDHHILDGLFGWRSEGKETKEDDIVAATGDIGHAGPLHWHWHQPVHQKHKEETKPAETSEKKLTEVQLNVDVVEPAGAPVTQERRIEMATTAPTVMSQAFHDSRSKQHQQHGHGRHSDRREQPRPAAKPETSKS